MCYFEVVCLYFGVKYVLCYNDLYLISFDLVVVSGCQQGIYLVELEDELDCCYLCIFMLIGLFFGIDLKCVLCFNWEQCIGFFVVVDFDGLFYLYLCENCFYDVFDVVEFECVIMELGMLGDQLEQVIVVESDSF